MASSKVWGAWPLVHHAVRERESTTSSQSSSLPHQEASNWGQVVSGLRPERAEAKAGSPSPPPPPPNPKQ
eukprot:1160880-Pelagomonas_calceolata.AAC.8